MKKILVSLSLTIALLCTTTVFAAGFSNSTGSQSGDIASLTNQSYDVAGVDASQEKISEYQEVYCDNSVSQHKLNVYACVADGENLYEPSNAMADENGFVDGSVVVGMSTNITMNGEPDEEGYYTATVVGEVKGNISGTTTINVVPDSEFQMYQDGEKPITATVEQNYTKFVIGSSFMRGDGINKHVTPTFNDKAVFETVIKTNEATAGTWKGTYNTEIYLSN